MWLVFSGLGKVKMAHRGLDWVQVDHLHNQVPNGESKTTHTDTKTGVGDMPMMNMVNGYPVVPWVVGQVFCLVLVGCLNTD